MTKTTATLTVLAIEAALLAVVVVWAVFKVGGSYEAPERKE